MKTSLVLSGAALVSAQNKVPLPDWGVAIFLAVWLLIGIFILTMFIKRRRQK